MQNHDSEIHVTDESIAIVGMACRYPGNVRTPEDLWDLLRAGADAITEFPGDRGWDVAALYDPDPRHAGTSYTRHGGFVPHAPALHPQVFRLSPRPAPAAPSPPTLLRVA